MAIAKQSQLIATRRERIANSKREAEKLEIDLARAESEIMPERVTLTVATEVARSVIRAFDDYRGDIIEETSEFQPTKPKPRPSLDDRITEFWRSIDAARDRLATMDVDDDAQLAVIVIEGVISACERWEMVRSSRLAADESMMGLPPSLGDCPADNRPTEVIEKDLRTWLAGGKPDAFDSLGSIVAQQVSPDQAGKMIGLTLPNGDVCWGTLGRLIDTPDRPQPGFRALRWLGTHALETAWSRRQADVMPSREAKRSSFIASAHGAVRPSRMPAEYPARVFGDE